MNIYAAGWMLQKPDLNFFKKFLRLNKDCQLAGIIYPEKIPEDIEGIPVLDFKDGEQTIVQGDIVLDASANASMQKAFGKYFGARQIAVTSIPDYVGSLIADDHCDGLRLPFYGILSQDVQALKRTAAPTLVGDQFLDFESYDVASKLDNIFRRSEWGRLCEFDRDETPENVLFDIMRDLHSRGVIKHLSVLDSPVVFLNAILKVRLHDSKASFTVALSDHAVKELGHRLEFYQRCLADCLVPFTHSDAGQAEDAVLLSGSTDQVTSMLHSAGTNSAIFFMRRSIIDYGRLKHLIGDRTHRVLLRQPDTEPSNLIAALLSPAA
jgi:hypothetical protein